jgi:hypothetical protein
MTTQKEAIVWQEQGATGNIIGTALELFQDCTFTFHANAGKRVNLRFKNPKGLTASVLLSKALEPEFRNGTLDRSAIFALPIYKCTDLKDDDDNIIMGDNGEPLVLLVAGKPETIGAKVSDIDKSKIKTYKPINDTSFDEYF